MTWDAKEKMYKEYVFSGDFPGALVERAVRGDALGLSHGDGCPRRNG